MRKYAKLILFLLIKEIMAKCIICKTKNASYGFKQWEGLYCAPHGKEKGARDVMHPQCAEDGCDKRIRVNGHHHCAKHDVAHQNDKKQKKIDQLEEKRLNPTSYDFCRNTSCWYMKTPTKATFGYEPKKALRCSQHREEGMYDVWHAVCDKCFAEGKRTRASFDSKKHCAQHRDV